MPLNIYCFLYLSFFRFVNFTNHSYFRYLHNWFIRKFYFVFFSVVFYNYLFSSIGMAKAALEAINGFNIYGMQVSRDVIENFQLACEQALHQACLHNNYQL